MLAACQRRSLMIVAKPVMKNIAIIGIGAIANRHAQAISDIDGVQLVAGCCRTEATGREFAARFGCRWYGDYGEMLDREKPDVVTICTPSGAHLDPAIACAARGIHILCEKPLEITIERSRKMINAADRAGVMLGGIFPLRFSPAATEVYQAAKQGRFGALSAVTTYVPWWRDDAYYGPKRWQGTAAMDGGGALMNQAIHGLDMLQWIAGAAMPELPGSENPVAEVFAWTAKRAHDEQLLEVEDTAVAVLRLRNGALGQILAATSMYPGSPRRFQIAGRDGTAEIMEDRLATYHFRSESQDDSLSLNKCIPRSKALGGESNPMNIDHVLHARNISSFINAIDDRQANLINGEEATKSIAIVEAIYESTKTGLPVSVR